MNFWGNQAFPVLYHDEKHTKMTLSSLLLECFIRSESRVHLYQGEIRDSCYGATAAPVVDRWLQLPPDLFSRVSPAGNQLAAIIFCLHRRLT